MPAPVIDVSKSGRRSRRGARGQPRVRSGSVRRASGPSRRPVERAAEAPATHEPVLVEELVAVLEPREGQIAVDCTFGAGGHAREIARRLGSTGTLIAIDRDPAAERCYEALAREMACSTRFIQGGYREGLEGLAAEGLEPDIVYFDLGMSSMQLDRAERGFAYSYDAPLDMRMDPRQDLTAWDIVNDSDERELASVMRRLGEERHAGAIARAIAERRAAAPIESTLQLVEAINAAIPTPARFAAGHPARRVFQALRIAVNEELDQLDGALPVAWSMLREGGVLAAIAFHSLEDRRVKRFLAARVRGCVCPPELPVCVCHRSPEAELRSRRAIVPTAAEMARNPRASSARLRAARKLAVEPGEEPNPSREETRR